MVLICYIMHRQSQTEKSGNESFKRDRINSDVSAEKCDNDSELSNIKQSDPGLSASVSSTVAEALNSLLRWSPIPSQIIKRTTDSANNSSQESSCDAITDMNDSPVKRAHNTRANSAPIIHAHEDVGVKSLGPGSDQEKTHLGEVKELPDQPQTPVKKSRSRHSSGSVDDKSQGERSSVERSLGERSNDGRVVERSPSNASGDRVPGLRMTEKCDKTPKSSDSSNRLSTGSIPERSSGFKVMERTSDSTGSRSSSEITGGHHSRERSFEKSLDNIMDKCSEKSLDLTLSIENKSEAVSDTGKSVEDGCSTTSTSTKKSDKKKKNSPWYTMWSPTYKSRTEEFRKLFKDVPKEERLIVDYSCALQKDILVHGRMYVSQNWICFYANIFRWETTLMIPCKDISAITKEKTARVIPNAIQISADREKYFFTSFGARDKTYMMLFKIWQNALLDKPMSPKELWQTVHYSYGEELGLTSSDDDYVSPPVPIEEGESMTGLGRNSKSDHTDYCDILQEEGSIQEGMDIVADDNVFQMMHQPQVENGDVPTDFGDTTEDSEGEVTCDYDQLERLTLDEFYHISIDMMFELLFTDSSSFKNFLGTRKISDWSATPWQEDNKTRGIRSRTVTYVLALNYSIGPKSSQTVEKQTCLKQSNSGSYYVIDVECTCPGIPYGDTFMVVNRYCLSRASKTKSRLKVTSEVRYKKSVWGLVKSMIEKNSYQGVIDYFKALDIYLKREEKQETSKLQHSKKKLRKRRSRTVQNAAENPKLKPTRHLSLMETKSKQGRQPIVIQPSLHNLSVQREELSQLNADTLVRVILVVLVLLVIFNAILFYKLWSLETYTNVLYFPHAEESIEHIVNYPKTQEEWVNLLKQQQVLHESEVDKWKDILSTSIILVDQMKSTLSQLKGSLEKRIKTKDIYTTDNQHKTKL